MGRRSRMLVLLESPQHGHLSTAAHATLFRITVANDGGVEIQSKLHPPQTSPHSSAPAPTSAAPSFLRSPLPEAATDPAPAPAASSPQSASAKPPHRSSIPSTPPPSHRSPPAAR